MVLGVATVLLNVVAIRHARAMVRWSDDGSRTESPERLGTLAKLGVLLGGVTVPRPRDERTPSSVGLAFENVFFEVPGGPRLVGWYVPSDTGDERAVVVCFHGYAESMEQLLDVAVALHELGHDALLVDFRGSGASSGDGTTLGVREAQDVAAALRFARRRASGRPVVAYGFSMGAAAVVRAIARERATFDGAILEACFDRLVTTTGNRFRSMGLPATPFAQLLVFWGGVAADIDGFDLDPVRDAERLTCPVLAMHGTADERVTLDQGRSVADAVAGGAEFVTFEGAGHRLLVRADRERWRTAVEAFLAGIPQPNR